MVKLSEVTDEHFEEIPPHPSSPNHPSAGPADDDDDFEDYTDSEDSSSPRHRHQSGGGRGGNIPRRGGGVPPKPTVEDAASSSGESDSEDEDDADVAEETLYDRLVALKDIMPIKQRERVSRFVGGVTGAVTWAGRTGASLLFILSTGALMVGVPYALAVAEEAQMVEMEREMKLQESANELLAAGKKDGQQAGQAAASGARY